MPKPSERLDPTRRAAFAAGVRERLTILADALKISESWIDCISSMTDDELCEDRKHVLIEFAVKHFISLDYLICGNVRPSLIYAAHHLRTTDERAEQRNARPAERSCESGARYDSGFRAGALFVLDTLCPSAGAGAVSPEKAAELRRTIEAICAGARADVSEATH